MFFLEQNLFRKNGKKYSQEVSDITLTSCKNPKEELVYTARMINDYVQNKGMRYKEIAIVTGDVESCSNYVERIFTQYNIPFFLDTTKDILFHPFIEFSPFAPIGFLGFFPSGKRQLFEDDAHPFDILQ